MNRRSLLRAVLSIATLGPLCVRKIEPERQPWKYRLLYEGRWVEPEFRAGRPIRDQVMFQEPEVASWTAVLGDFMRANGITRLP